MARNAFLFVKPLHAMFHFSLNRHDGWRISKSGIRELNGRSPLYSVHDHLLDFRLMINGKHLMAGPEVKNFALSTVPAEAAAEYLAALKPADKHLLIRLGNIKSLTIHLFVGNHDLFV